MNRSSKPFNALRVLAAGTWLGLGTVGCLNLEPSADPTRYFLLQPGDPGATETGSQAGPTVGIAAVRVPEYLRRPWMVVRTGGTEIRYSDFNRWGEPLDKGIQRVVAANLGALLGTDAVQLTTWKRGSEVATVRLAVDRFDVRTDGTVVLDVRWQIQREEDTRTGRSVLQRTGPAPADDPEGAVVTMSDALVDLATRIAADLDGTD